MKRVTLALLLGTFLCDLCPGTTAVLVASENACVQDNYQFVTSLDLDPNIVFANEPEAATADPNVVVNALLGPIPHDPDTWTVIPGAFDRLMETCDADGDPVGIVIVSSKDGRAKLVDVGGATHLQATVAPGDYWVFVRITDVPPAPLKAKSQLLLIAFNVRSNVNNGPVLY